MLERVHTVYMVNEQWSVVCIMHTLIESAASMFSYDKRCQPEESLLFYHSINTETKCTLHG